MDKRKGQAGAGDSHSVQAGADRQAFMVNAENQERECVVFSFPPSVLQADREERGVERINQYPLYELGKELQKLDAYRGDVLAKDVFFRNPFRAYGGQRIAKRRAVSAWIQQGRGHAS